MRTRQPRVPVAKPGSPIEEEEPLRLAAGPVGHVLVPDQVDVVNHDLVFQGGNARTPTPKMLRAFLALDQASDDQLVERVVVFVREWGPLGLCEAHGLPFSHLLASGGGLCPIRTLVARPGAIRGKCEAVRGWRPFIQVAAALWRLSGRLHEAERGGGGWPWGGDQEARREWERDWRLVLDHTAEWRRAELGHVRRTPQREWARRWYLDPVQATLSKWQRASVLFEHWRALAEMIEPWLRWADVRPQLLVRRPFRDDERVPAEPIELVDDGYLTFGALALQLAAALTGSGERLVRCIGRGPRCEGQFVTGHPARRYCASCAKVRGRRASKTYYWDHAEKLRAKRRRRYHAQKRRNWSKAPSTPGRRRTARRRSPSRSR